MFLTVPKEYVLSLTPDHGTEFLRLDDIKDDLSVTIYSPDPYSSSQHGTNETTNGLIREYFPKNTDIVNDQEKIYHCQSQLDTRMKPFRRPIKFYIISTVNLTGTSAIRLLFRLNYVVLNTVPPGSYFLDSLIQFHEPQPCISQVDTQTTTV